MRLLSAVFTKEMVTLSRRKNQYVARALLLGALLAAIGFSWRGAMPEADSLTDLSFTGHKLFGIFSLFQIAAVMIITPAFTAPVIATEKDKKTLWLLLMSNLSHREILLDKLLSRLSVLILLSFSGLPLFLVLLSFGGIEPDEIIALYKVTLAVTLLCVGSGLIFSTLMNKMHSALIMTYASIPVFAYLYGFDSAAAFNMESCAEQLLSDELIIYYAICFFLLSLYACSFLLPLVAARDKQPPLKRFFRWLNRFFGRINFSGIVIMREHVPPSGNAMLWKEMHKQFYSSSIFHFRSLAALLILSIIGFTSILFSKLELRDFVGIIVFLNVLIAFVIVLAGSSAAFTSERQQQTHEILMTTPLTAYRFVTAKFLGVLKLSFPPLACIAIWMLFNNAMPYRSKFTGLDILLFFTSLLGYHIPLITTIGLYASATRRRSSTAFCQAFLLCAALSLVPIAVVYATERLLDQTPYYLTNGIWRLLFSPIGTLWRLSDALHTSGTGFLSLFHYSLLFSPIWIIVLAVLVRRFDRIAGRQ